MNPVVHFEMPYKVAVRVKKFYSEVFNWDLEQLGPDMGDYILATTATVDAKPGTPAGAIGGGLYPIKPEWPDQCPSIVIGVENIDESIKKINENNGEVLGDPMEIPGYGLYVSFRDTEGNRVSIIEPKGM